MPVRSLNSSVLKWPDASAVDYALREWIGRVISTQPGVEAVGFFGSYARGDWGVGSDLDIVVLMDSVREPFEKRGTRLHGEDLPVPADILVYSLDEWNASERTGFMRHVRGEVKWLWRRDEGFLM